MFKLFISSRKDLFVAAQKAISGFRLRGWLAGVVVATAFTLQVNPTIAQTPSEEIPSTATESQSAGTLGLASTSAEKGNPPSTPGINYVIGPEDMLEIQVFEVSDLNATVRVANDGSVTLALLGKVPASGLTAPSLQRELEALYSQKYVVNPQVSVFIKEFHSRPVSVIGAVEHPGLYTITAPRKLIDVLAMAGGLATRQNGGAGNAVIVTRPGGFGNLELSQGMRLIAPDKLEVNLSRLLFSHDDSVNIDVHPLDTISVKKGEYVYVVGLGVQSPGQLSLEDRGGITVSQALAMSQGFSANAAKKNGFIMRQAEDGTRTKIPVNLEGIMNGKSPDVAMNANDVLFVPNNAQKAALKRGVDVVVSTLSGLLIFGRL